MNNLEGNNEIVLLHEDVSQSPLYGEDLAPVPPSGRTWSKWHLAALWVGMAVCIPTYLLASYMITGGMNWIESLIIIGLANLIITIPMVLNGHAGVKYGIPFPVLGRASFGTKGIHLPAIIRALVACGWFGIQTWIGGLAIYAIAVTIMGYDMQAGLVFGKFAGFAVFWFINLYFIWKGTESIKFLEQYSAPILVIMGILLIIWGSSQAGGFGKVLQQSEQLENPGAAIEYNGNHSFLVLNPIKDKVGKVKADSYQITKGTYRSEWLPLDKKKYTLEFSKEALQEESLFVTFRKSLNDESYLTSSSIEATSQLSSSTGTKLWQYLFWLTVMVGFWATMSLSIADITRYASSQSDQIAGQFIGLPGTMLLYSFVGIFVTCAAVINFDDILIGADAPWDPVSLLAKFDSATVVIVSQIFMLIATLSTNIAANVIAPSNAFANLSPQKISFRTGGIITAIIGILLCPWWIMDDISSVLIFVSALLGPVLGVMLADYFTLRKKRLELAELYKVDGIYSYKNGFNSAAIIAFTVGVGLGIIGSIVPKLGFLYDLSWFTGFFVAFAIYYLLMRKNIEEVYVDIN